MADLITITDFTGVIALQTDQYTEATLNKYISEYSRDAVRELLGQELGDLFLADFDVTGTPTGVYATIWNELYLTYSNCEYKSKGLAFYLSRIIWFYYARDNNVTITIGGNKSKASQNSTPNADPGFLAKVWNSGINTGQVIQMYCLENSTDYPTFNGQKIDLLIGL